MFNTQCTIAQAMFMERLVLDYTKCSAFIHVIIFIYGTVNEEISPNKVTNDLSTCEDTSPIPLIKLLHQGR